MLHQGVSARFLVFLVLCAGCASFASSSAPSLGVRPYQLPYPPAPKPTGCPLLVLRWPPPPGSIQPIAVIDYRDPRGYMAADRPRVESALAERACALGADGLLIDREEYARPHVGTDVTSTAFVWTSRPARQVEAMRPGMPCDPPCSPGYECHDGMCAPLCNPACASDKLCGPDRVCR